MCVFGGKWRRKKLNTSLVEREREKRERGREHKSHPHVSHPQPLGGKKSNRRQNTARFKEPVGRRRFSTAGLFKNSTIKHPSAVMW